MAMEVGFLPAPLCAAASIPAGTRPLSSRGELPPEDDVPEDPEDPVFPCGLVAGSRVSVLREEIEAILD